MDSATAAKARRVSGGRIKRISELIRDRVLSRLARGPAWRGVGIAAWALALGACSAFDYNEDVVNQAKEMSTGPANRPTQSSTGFADALRCMDFAFLTYGVKNLSLLVEDLPDATRKVNASGKDMMISAISQMTRRSRALHLVAFSINDQTLGAVIGMNTRNRVLDVAPDFTIRGSVSQFDDSVVRKQGDVGVGWNVFNAGAAGQGSASVLALDLSVINTNDLSLVPGVTSKNSVLTIKTGKGADGEINTRKFGVNFSFVQARSEGTAQALRTLAELAAIELTGKLTKIPYWSCLGVGDDDPQVLTEITDWWETLAADPPSLVAYLQQQMRARQLYKGDVNGRVDDALLHSIGLYQRAMGLNADATINFDFFRSYLKADHVSIQEKALALAAADPVPAPAADAGGASAVAGTGGVGGASGVTGSARTDTGDGSSAGQGQALAATAPGKATATVARQSSAVPLVRVVPLQGTDSLQTRGVPYEIVVTVDEDASLYCFMVDENRQTTQFFPNPAYRDPVVKGGSKIQFPGPMPFRLIASPRGNPESIACFATTTPLGFQPIDRITSVRDVDSLQASFGQVAGSRFGMGVFDVRTR